MLSTLIVVAALAGATPQESLSQEKAKVRSELIEVYKGWDSARMSLDKDALSRALLTDFFVVLPKSRQTRQEFLDSITAKQTNSRRLRFLSKILTVNKKDDDWVVIDSEKSEFIVTPSGKPSFHAFSHWITRDTWHKTEGVGWQARSSEWIGNEGWRDKAPADFWQS